MKNGEHEKLISTINKHTKDTQQVSEKSKAINKLSIELNGLSNEIRNTRVGYRYLHDFEKYFYKPTSRTAEYVICQPKEAEQRTLIDFSWYKNHDYFLNCFDKIRKDKENNQFISDNLFIKEPDEIIKREVVEMTHEFYISSSNMPLRHVLENSRKVVFTKEMIFANEEYRIIKKLRRIENERLKNRLKLPENYVMNCYNDIDAKKIICKILAHLCKEFVDKNSIYVNGNKILLFKSVKYYTTKKYVPKTRIPYDRNHAGVFELISKNKSVIRFPIQQPKKYISAQHTSHLNIIRRIQPELSKIQNPSGILEYKNKVKNKGIGIAAPFRREMGNNGKLNISDNVTYSVRSEMRKR